MGIKDYYSETGELNISGEYLVSNSDLDQELESIARVASYVCKTPFVLIMFSGEGRQWIKANVGLEDYPDFRNAFSEPGRILIDGDIPAGAFADHFKVRFFHVNPLINTAGFRLGSFCVMDTTPRSLDAEQLQMLDILSKTIISHLENLKRNEELKELLMKANKFQSLFNNSSEIHCITNSDGTIEFIGDSVEYLLGYKASEVLGKNIWDFTVPGERDRNMPAIYSAIQDGEDTFHIETLVLTKDGQERWYSWSDVIKQGYWLVNGRDVTEFKEKELQLQTLSLAVEKSSVGVLIRNDKDHVIWINPALEGLIGYKSSELMGKSLGEMLVGKDTDGAVLQVAKIALANRIPYEVELLLYKKDKTPVWLFLSNNPIYNSNNELEKQVCIVVDATERKKAEFELIKTRDDALRLGNAKESFLSVMSHEMRTPLNAVIGITRTLMEDNPMDHQLENLNILKFSSENLLSLINDVLDYTKIETGNLHLENITFDVKRLVYNTLEALRYKTNEKNIKLIANIDSRIPDYIKGDPTRLTQVFNNLLGNAVKFTEEGQIELRLVVVEKKEGRVSIKFSVSDTGIGIPSEKILSIFNAYTQAGADISRKYGGTGLGLTITKRLLELQDSTIHIESELGSGTTFYFTIDFQEADAPPPAETFETQDAVFNAKVLVVDDNAMNRLLAKKLFNKWNIQPDFAEDGAEALQKIDANNYDLVFMDIHMPVLDGVEATKRLRERKEEKFRRLPVIALTGSVLKKDEHDFQEAGMNGFLLKPFEPQNILKVLKQYLDYQVREI